MRALLFPALLLAALAAPPRAPAAPPLSTGTPLPSLHGELLAGGEADLPALTHGHVALLAFGFTRGSSKDVQAWGARFKAAYGSDSAFTWIEVPLMSSAVARLMKPVIEGSMRNGTPEPDRRHVLTVWGAPHEWKDWLAFAAPNPAYLVLLDREGRVRWRGVGPLDDDRWRALAAATDASR